RIGELAQAHSRPPTRSRAPRSFRGCPPNRLAASNALRGRVVVKNALRQNPFEYQAESGVGSSYTVNGVEQEERSRKREEVLDFPLHRGDVDRRRQGCACIRRSAGEKCDSRPPEPRRQLRCCQKPCDERKGNQVPRSERRDSELQRKEDPKAV